jgi:small subunit ribosomal protein S17
MARERRKMLVGRVISDKMDKTVIVQVGRLKRHSLFGKVIRRRKRYKVHDQDNSCHVGDLVRIMESKPISRHKRWVVTEILEHADL